MGKVHLSKFLFFIIALVTYHSERVLSADFKISAPIYWQKITDDPGGNAIYKNMESKSNEMIIIQSYKLRSQDDSFESDLQSQSEKISKARADFLSNFGINKYFILGIKKVQLKNSKFPYRQEIQSRYLDSNGRDVQSVERQYINRGVMYSVTYLVNAVSFNDLKKVDSRLNFFEPLPRTARLPSSIDEAAPSEEYQWTGQDISDVEPQIDFDWNGPASQKVCDSVPEDQRRVKEPGQMTLAESAKSFAQIGASCFIKAPWNSIQSLSKLLVYPIKLAINRKLQDQLISTIGILSAEAQKDPQGFAMRTANMVGDAIYQYFGKAFLCYSSEAQAEAICKVGADLMSGGLLLKLSQRIKLSAAESLQVKKAAEAALTKGAAKSTAANAPNAPTTSTAGAPPATSTTAPPTSTTGAPASAPKSAPSEVASSGPSSPVAPAEKVSIPLSPNAAELLTKYPILKDYPKLAETLSKFSFNTIKSQVPKFTKVNSVDQIPWTEAADRFIGSGGGAKLAARVGKQSENIKNTMVGVWNRLNDPVAIRSYMEKLAVDTVAEVKSRAIPKELKMLEDGQLTRNAILRVLVKRAKERGQGNISIVLSKLDDAGNARPIKSTSKPASNVGFRTAVGDGPFFDKPFADNRHGIDIHLLQKDIVADVVAAGTNGNPSEFWNFLGSTAGINFWVPLFDSAHTSFTQPEVLHHLIENILPLK